MLRIFKFLLTGDWHLHEWELLETRDIRGFGFESEHIVKKAYTCQCKICGKVKQQSARF